MGLETVERIKKQTQELKKQAQELIDPAYQRGYKAGYEDGVNAGYNTGATDGYKKGFEEGYSNAEIDYHAQTEDDRQSSYELGLNMAWYAAQKLVSAGYKECNEILGDGVLEIESVDDVFVRCTASEAIKKLNEYEQKKQKINYLVNFCKGRYCTDCVLHDFLCGRGHHWTIDPNECGDIDKAYDIAKEYEEKQQKQDDEIRVGDEVIWTEDNSEFGVVTRIESSENAMWIVKPDGLQVCANKCSYWKKTGRHFPEIAEVLEKMKEDDNSEGGLISED